MSKISVQSTSPTPMALFVSRGLTVFWWLGIVLLGVFAAMLGLASLAHLGFSPAESLFKDHNVQNVIRAIIRDAIRIAVFLVVVAQLRKICATLLAGDPFVSVNAKRMRVIWIIVGISEIVRLIFPFLAALINPDASGDIEIHVRLYVWFLVLALMVLAEIFAEGTRLRQEQKLTI